MQLNQLAQSHFKELNVEHDNDNWKCAGPLHHFTIEFDVNLMYIGPCIIVILEE